MNPGCRPKKSDTPQPELDKENILENKDKENIITGKESTCVLLLFIESHGLPHQSLQHVIQLFPEV